MLAHRHHQRRARDRRRHAGRDRGAGRGPVARRGLHLPDGDARHRPGDPRAARRAGTLMLDRLIRGFGVDPIQWRSLVMVYLRMDFRATGGATTQQATGRKRGYPLFGIALVTGMGGALFAILAVRVPDILISASLLTTYGAINTVMVLLVDFTGLVVSPDDYAVLGHRPVSSRTYFAARLTAILA